MRADRLLSILLLLQTRGRLSAETLARELEVSVRTIYRDVDALSTAGIPISAERGVAGGFQLLAGYRTRLTGLTQTEAESLFLAGLPGPAADLGLDTSLALAQLKLLAALPPELQARAERLRQRFHLDAPTWFQTKEDLAHLGAVADAVWNQHRLQIRYERTDRQLVTRTVEPLGLVLKAGVWYLVAQVAQQSRVYRIGRIHELTVLDESFTRPPDFDLIVFWQTWSDRFERSVYHGQATLHVTQHALDWLTFLFGPVVNQAAAESRAPTDKPDWFEIEVPIESIDHAAAEFLRLGTDAEVIAPQALRERMAEIVSALKATYIGDS